MLRGNQLPITSLQMTSCFLLSDLTRSRHTSDQFDTQFGRTLPDDAGNTATHSEEKFEMRANAHSSNKRNNLNAQ